MWKGSLTRSSVLIRRLTFHRFNAAVAVLRERHLVERYILPNGDYLRTHRALQRTILQRLDLDLEKRQKVFDEIIEIVSNSFPAANILTRGDTSQYQQSARYLPQVLSIHANYKHSEPPMKGRLTFARLLSDVGYYGVNNANQAEVLDLMETGETICRGLLGHEPAKIRPILGDIIGPMQVLIQYLGVDGRRRALEINKFQIENRRKQLEGIPGDQLTQLDNVNLARAHNDMGVSLCQLNRVDEAKPLFDQALEYYQRAGSEETLTSRFGHIYCFRMLPLAVNRQTAELREMARRSMTLVAKAVGEDSPLGLQTKFFVGMTHFTLGYLDEALQLHREVLEKRLACLGIRHHLTLASQYNVAVAYQNTGNLDQAEYVNANPLCRAGAYFIFKQDSSTRHSCKRLQNNDLA